jgi:proteic killer suppression protein
MIKTFRHKGLKALYLTQVADDLDEPGMRLHPLKGELAGFWSVSVSGNWRVIFRFIGTDVELVDYLDYH